VKIYCSDAQAPPQPGLFQIGKKRERTDTKGVYFCGRVFARLPSLGGFMFDISDPDFRDKLAARLAHKTGLQKEHALKFLDALSDVNSEEEQEHNLPGHVISIPLVEQEDGTTIVDTSGHSAWWPWWPFKPRWPRPPGTDPGSGAYPGPSVHIRVNDWLGADLKLD
jgi:hypothetical protein